MRYKHTVDELRVIAGRFTSRRAFYEGNRRAYSAALRRGVLDSICGHMTPKRRNHYSAKELCKEAARYQHRKDFEKGSPRYCAFARAHGLLDAIAVHMTPKVQGATAEEILQLAAPYPSLKDFRHHHPKEYSRACTLNILDELHQICPKIRKRRTDESLRNEAQKYSSMHEVLHNDRPLYRALWEKLRVDPDFLERAGIGLKKTYRLGRTSKVYAYVFQDGATYIGYTRSTTTRFVDHRTKVEHSAVATYAAATNLPVPEPTILQDGLSQEEAMQLEKAEIARRQDRGIQLINRTNGGEPGGTNWKWTTEKAWEAARECASGGYNHFVKQYPGAFQYLYRHNLIKACFHDVGMVDRRRKRTGLFTGTLDDAWREIEDSINVGMRAVRSEHPGVHDWLAKNGELEAVRTEVKRRKRERRYQQAAATARRFQTKRDLIANEYGAYQVLLRLGQLQEACAHMQPTPPRPRQRRRGCTMDRDQLLQIKEEAEIAGISFTQLCRNLVDEALQTKSIPTPNKSILGVRGQRASHSYYLYPQKDKDFEELCRTVGTNPGEAIRRLLYAWMVSTTRRD